MKTYSFVLVGALALAACSGNPPSESSRSSATPSARAPVVDPGSAIKPPFDVKDDSEGLMLVWYDAQGDVHMADKRADIPEDRRSSVRVDALEVAPDKRLDPDFVYVADLRSAGPDGQYPVRKVLRDAFEATLPSTPRAAVAEAQPGEGEHSGSSDVIIYGASWCGACKQAKQFFARKGVPFIEKDIEKEPGARNEMLAKAQAQGVRTSGIPVIDVKGTLLGGFNAQRIEQLLASR